MVVFNKINLLEKTSESYRLIQLENKEVNIPDIILLYKNKYTENEVLAYKSQLIPILEDRVHVIKTVLSFLFDVVDFNILYVDKYINDVNIEKAIERYNNVLAKGYTNMKLTTVEEYLINKYQVMDYTSFFNKELIESEDFMFSYLMAFVSDYKCYNFFYDEIVIFFNDLLDKEKKINYFFSFFFFQYEYYFFLDTLNFFLCSGLKDKRDELFIKNSIYKSSILLNFSFAKSNKGLYHSSNDLSCSFIGFLELHIKDLYLLLNNPETNTFSYYRYLENKYGDVIYPFCILNNKNEIVFNYFDNMVDFNYMQDFINSYLRYVLNTNNTLLYDTLVIIKTELKK